MPEKFSFEYYNILYIKGFAINLDVFIRDLDMIVDPNSHHKDKYYIEFDLSSQDESLEIDDEIKSNLR